VEGAEIASIELLLAEGRAAKLLEYRGTVQYKYLPRQETSRYEPDPVEISVKNFLVGGVLCKRIWSPLKEASAILLGRLGRGYKATFCEARVFPSTQSD
jgi:hypothetical protein